MGDFANHPANFRGILQEYTLMHPGQAQAFKDLGKIRVTGNTALRFGYL
jgi:hypothetical protein